MHEMCNAVHGDIMRYHAGQIRDLALRKRFLEVAGRRTSLRAIEEYRIPQRGGFVTLGEQRTLIIHDPRTGKGEIGRAKILLPGRVIEDLYRARIAAREGKRARVSDRSIELAAHEGMHFRRKVSGAPETELAHLRSTYAADHKQMMRDMRVIFGKNLAENYARYWPTGIVAEAVEKVAEERAADEAAIRAVVEKRVAETCRSISREELVTIKEGVMAGRPWPIRRAVEADLRMAAAARRGEARFKPRRPGALEELSNRLERSAADIVSGWGSAEGLFHPAAPFLNRGKGFSPPGRSRRAA